MFDDFVDVAQLDETILFDIRYATTNNFTGQVLYSASRCFLRKRVALKLIAVQDKLKQMGLGLKVWDGYRPPDAAKLMWEVTPDRRYVADPKVGSKHTRGAAVDVTLVDRAGNELQMPTPFDEFTERAHRNFMDLPEHVLANRDLLEKVMEDSGFLPLPTEWWHFDDEEWEKCPLVDFSFEALGVTCGV